MKSQQFAIWGASRLVSTSTYQEDDAPQLHRSSCGQDPSRVHSVSFITTFNKFVNVFPQVLWAAVAN